MAGAMTSADVTASAKRELHHGRTSYTVRPGAATCAIRSSSPPHAGRIDVCDRLREGPEVAARILGGVLPLAERVRGGLLQDPRAPLRDRTGAMRVGIVHADHGAMERLTSRQRRPRRSVTTIDPSPKHNWIRWLAMRSRTRNPKASHSQAAAVPMFP